ncbi:MAG TPA: Ltp family lipoprotein [Candidatus Saccharimonadales bacterium]
MGFREDTRADRWRAIPTWQVVTALIVFFPVGLYLVWRQDRWSKRAKKITTWATSGTVVALLVVAVIFAPPTVSLTSSLASTKADSYQLTGKISPAGSQVTVNGSPAKVSGDTFSVAVPLSEGDNNLKVVAISGGKRTEQVFKIHRYTKSEVTAQENAAKAKADAAAAKKKADDDAAAKAKQQQAAAAKAKADADAAAQAAKDKATADAAAQAKAAASVTVSQKNALAKAKSYLNYTAFSHDGLVDQLEYEQFSAADATYGADNSGADWNAQAAKKAKDYMSYSSFSRGGLIDQLEYEKFTPDQAAYGANAVGL